MGAQRRSTRQSAFLFLACLSLAARAEEQKPANGHSDESAEAYVVEKMSDRWSFENDGTALHESSARIKIQSDSALQRFGVVDFAYQKSNDTLQIDYVRVQKPNGTSVTTPLEDIQDIPSEITRQAPFYSDIREKQVPVKGLGVGDTLEYAAHWQISNPLVPGEFWLSSEFATSEIVGEQVIEIATPVERQLKVKSPTLAPAVSMQGKKRVYTWKRSNLEREKTSKIELAQLAIRGKIPVPDILVSSFQSWADVARWYDQLQQQRIVPTKELREKAAELTRDAKDDQQKLAAIYKHVSDLRYIGVAFGIGRYQPHFAAEVLANQYGDCKDKHTLLAGLLAAAGIQSFPALINSSRVVDADVPSPGQFDHVITAVPQGKEILWLDSTAQVAPVGYLLPALRNKDALVASAGGGEFKTTAADPPFPGSWIFKIDAKLDDSGTLEGKIEQSIRGDLEIPLRAAIKALPKAQWKDLIQQLSYTTGFAGDVSDVNIVNADSTDAPLRFSYTYKRKEYPDWKNQRITPPAPTVLSLPLEEEGKLPSVFWLGSPAELDFESRVELPKGYLPDLPGKKDLVQPFLEYHSSYSAEASTLIARYRIALKAREVAGAGVKTYKELAEKALEDRDRYIDAISQKSESPEEAVGRLRGKIWNLPDSSDPKAMEFEQQAKADTERKAFPSIVSHLKKAVEEDPKFTRDWIWLASMYLAAYQWQDGLEALKKAIASDPKQLLPRKLLGFTYASMQEYDKAIETWQEVTRIAPDDRDIASTTGWLLVQLKKYQEAIPYLEAAVKLYPDSKDPLWSLAIAYLSSGRGQEARLLFDRLLQLEPGAETKNDIAYEMAQANKRLSDALRYAVEAVNEEEETSRKAQFDNLAMTDVKRAFNLAAYWDTLGWVHYRLGNLKQAEQYTFSAWSLLPNSVTGFHMAQIYEQQQRKTDAIHTYRQVLGMQGVIGQSLGPAGKEAVGAAQKRLLALGARTSQSHGTPPQFQVQEELSRARTYRLPKLAGKATAEFFVLFAPGKVLDTKFVSGSEELRSADKVLSQTSFNVPFPEGSKARLVRRGILACYPTSGCSFTLMPVDAVTSVD